MRNFGVVSWDQVTSTRNSKYSKYVDKLNDLDLLFSRKKCEPENKLERMYVYEIRILTAWSYNRFSLISTGAMNIWNTSKY